MPGRGPLGRRHRASDESIQSTVPLPNASVPFVPASNYYYAFAVLRARVSEWLRPVISLGSLLLSQRPIRKGGIEHRIQCKREARSEFQQESRAAQQTYIQ